mmetsp:Transcript_110559/g.311820  ORF Transcript_110559/g.311820 Transcript_110559/m.311820 type:complete len:214 (-) Transcript_110559:1106-1747(-)
MERSSPLPLTLWIAASTMVLRAQPKTRPQYTRRAKRGPSAPKVTANSPNAVKSLWPPRFVTVVIASNSSKRSNVSAISLGAGLFTSNPMHSWMFMPKKRTSVLVKRSTMDSKLRVEPHWSFCGMASHTARGYMRYTFPGFVRPTRPARCFPEVFEDIRVTSCSIWSFASKDDEREKPKSKTTLSSGNVIDVSAMEEAIYAVGLEPTGATTSPA